MVQPTLGILALYASLSAAVTSNATSKNEGWLQFSWHTLYMS